MESSLAVINQAGGKGLAIRTAVAPDELAVERHIQLVDFASRQIIPANMRGESSAVDAADTFDLTALPAEILSNALAIGDASILVCFPQHDSADGLVSLTPIFFDANDDIIGIGETKVSAVGDSAQFRFGGGGSYASPVLTWECCGANKVGLHITEIGGTANSIVLTGGII